MKSIDEIKANTQVKTFEESSNGMYSGHLSVHGDKRDIFFIMSIDRGEYEHVSVHYPSCLKQTPSWETMCRIKDIFWGADEEVHQIHPHEKEYVHQAGTLQNVLHLWRPIKGWNW